MTPAPELSNIACPRCGEHKVRPSIKKGPLDAMLSLLRVEPYRCRGCRRRFYRFGGLPRERQEIGQNESDEEDALNR